MKEPRLTEADVLAAAWRAREFAERRGLDRLVIATTAPKERAAQDAAEDAARQVGFQVDVRAWDDIVALLSQDSLAAVRTSHYGFLGLADSTQIALDGYLHRVWNHCVTLPSLRALRAEQSQRGPCLRLRR